MWYNRFVIAGQERTGSNYLLVLLASHRNVVAFGEIFNSSAEIRRTVRRIPDIIHLHDDPVEYLGTCVYREYPEHVQAVGFKLFYSQARNKEWNAVWDYLRSTRVSVLHLKRRNLLDRYLSHQLALRSNRWIALQGEENHVYRPIILDADDCLKEFHRSSWWQKEIDAFFKGNAILDVAYEDLWADPAGESQRIQDFLGLDYQGLWSKTVKQRTQKKRELIANYDDLKATLQDAVSRGWAREEWIGFFDEK